LNEVQAGGLTTKQLQEQIRAGYSRFVVEPLVSVVVLGIKSRNVYVLGSVKSPGVYPLVGPMTVVELIARAGGFADFAKSKGIVIIRLQKEKGTPTRFRFNYGTFVNGQNYEQNIQLRSGDKVFVP
jgi:polysaccharide export outer membrane protein